MSCILIPMRFANAAINFCRSCCLASVVALSLNNLAELFRAKGDYAQAEPPQQRALQIWEQALGSAHPDVAQSLNNLASLYHTRGDYTRAEPLYQRALRIWEQVLGHTTRPFGGRSSRPAVEWRRCSYLFTSA